MTTLPVAAVELSRIIKAVEKSVARDDSRPVLAGIHLTIDGTRITVTAADGFRLSTASATLEEPAPSPVAAILERAGLLAFAKSVKPKDAPLATIDTETWTFTANGTRAEVRQIDGTYPEVRQLVGDGTEPELFAVNPQYFRDTLASHGSTVVTVSRASDDPHAPLFFTAEDGTRHVVMPMVKPASAEWKRKEEAAVTTVVVTPEPVAVSEISDTPEPDPAPVTPEESAFRTQRAANDRRMAKRAARCATCDTLGEPSDNFCALCGSPFGEPAPVAMRPAPVSIAPDTTPALASYSAKNQERILTACPHATEVRTFNGWLAAGRVVRKGERGIKIVAPDQIDGEKVTSIRHIHVFDVTQTQERTERKAA